MAEIDQEIEEIEEKEDTYIRLFFSKRMVWVDKNCYKFLSRKQHKIAIFLLLNLEKLQPCTQEKLLEATKNDFNKFIFDTLKLYDSLPSKIKNSEFKWIIKKKKNLDEFKIYQSYTIIRSVLNYMTVVFINRKQIWYKDGRSYGANILALNRKGKRLVEAIQKREEKILENSVKNVENITT